MWKSEVTASAHWRSGKTGLSDKEQDDLNQHYHSYIPPSTNPYEPPSSWYRTLFPRLSRSKCQLDLSLPSDLPESLFRPMSCKIETEIEHQSHHSVNDIQNHEWHSKTMNINVNNGEHDSFGALSWTGGVHYIALIHHDALAAQIPHQVTIVRKKEGHVICHMVRRTAQGGILAMKRRLRRQHSRYSRQNSIIHEGSLTDDPGTLRDHIPSFLIGPICTGKNSIEIPTSHITIYLSVCGGGGLSFQVEQNAFLSSTGLTRDFTYVDLFCRYYTPTQLDEIILEGYKSQQSKTQSQLQSQARPHQQYVIPNTPCTRSKWNETPKQQFPQKKLSLQSLPNSGLNLSFLRRNYNSQVDNYFFTR